MDNWWVFLAGIETLGLAICERGFAGRTGIWLVANSMERQPQRESPSL